MLQAACVLGIEFLACGHNQYRNKCHLIPPSCSWGLPWVGVLRGVSFDSQEKMCPSIAWRRARFARPLQAHHCEEAMKAVHITDQPAQGVLGGPGRLWQCSQLALHFPPKTQRFVFSLRYSQRERLRRHLYLFKSMKRWTWLNRNYTLCSDIHLCKFSVMEDLV